MQDEVSLPTRKEPEGSNHHQYISLDLDCLYRQSFAGATAYGPHSIYRFDHKKLDFERQSDVPAERYHEINPLVRLWTELILTSFLID